AIQAGETSLTLNKLDANTLNNLAWLYATGKVVQDFNKAAEDAAKAVEYTHSTNANFLDTLAEVQFARGETRLAAETIDKAIRVERRKLLYLEGQRDKFTSGQPVK